MNFNINQAKTLFEFTVKLFFAGSAEIDFAGVRCATNRGTYKTYRNNFHQFCPALNKR